MPPSIPLPDDFDTGATLTGLRAGTTVFNGRYTLEKQVGRGGMGVVWLARDTSLDLPVALKFLAEELARDDLALADLKNETKRCLTLTHPNIVRVYNWLEGGGMAAVSMEYIDGASLSRLSLERPCRVFAETEVRAWVREICLALSHAHDGGMVVHRDLKPGNLMLTSSGFLKICDFGISRSMGESRSRLTGGRAGATSGTLSYMGPQHVLGMPPHATDDIYSLGATVYELFTGKPPFYTGSIERQIESVVPPPMAVRREELQVAGADPIPPLWETVVAACLEKDARCRPQSAAELWQWIESGIRPVADPPADAGPIGRNKQGNVSAADPAPPGSGENSGGKSKVAADGGIPGTRRGALIAAGLAVVAAGLWWGPKFFRDDPELSSGRAGAVHGLPVGPGMTMEMVWIPAADFIMGSAATGDGISADEAAVSVSVSSAFWIGKTEVTQGQWESVMGSNPSRFPGSPDLPVENVSWEDAAAFVDRLNKEHPPGRGWRWSLPTEAQWELACRAGTGASESGASVSAWHAGNSGWTTHPVAGLSANAHGLHDMTGNVWEWCADWYAPALTGGKDPGGPESGRERVRRGGSWSNAEARCRPSYRAMDLPAARTDHTGLRLAVVRSP